MIELTAKEVRPRLPKNVELGIEMHYDAEVNDKNAAAVADALYEQQIVSCDDNARRAQPFRLRRYRVAGPE